MSDGRFLDGRRKARFTVVAALAAWTLVEGVATVAHRFAEGSWPSPSATRSRHVAAIAESTRAGDEDTEGALVAVTAGMEVLHPYLGFVLDPSFDDRFPAGPGFRVDSFGFLRPVAAPETITTDDAVVAVLGGSVAVYLAGDAGPQIAQAFASRPAFAGRRIVVVPLALGGFKQPQQLMAVTYLLTQGRRFDALVAVDGFNEVALSVHDNYSRGVAPDYPRSWDGRVAGRPTARERLLLARAEMLRNRRQRWARLFDGLPFEASPTLSLVWLRIDRSIAGALAEVELERRADEGSTAGFQAHGRFHAFATDDELYAEIARAWADASLQLHRLATGNGIEYHHFLQPNQYDPGSKPLGPGERKVAVVEGSPFARSVPLGYPHLRREGARLAAEGVRFHDASRVFAEVEEALYVDACCHLSRRGNELLAAAIVAAVRGEGPGA